VSTRADRSPSLGIVIVSYNTRDLLDACLRSLQVELAAGGWQVDPKQARALDEGRPRAVTWVVDNGSHDGSAEMVARRYPWVQLHRSARNLGFTAGNNVVLAPWAAGDSCPDYVLLLNPDAELQPGALRVMTEAMDQWPRCGALGPQLVYADGGFQHAAFRDPGLVQAALDLWPVPRVQESSLNGRYPRERYAAGRPFRVDFVLGACLMMRGKALRAVGALDEGFFMYCEEIDWCRRARDLDWEVLCVPAATVLHHAGASSAQFRSASFVALWRSRLRYARLHLGPVQQRAYRVLLRAGLAWRSLRDGWAASRQRLSRQERSERRAAYRAIWRPQPPLGGPERPIGRAGP
jgi:hypothetical protein